MRKPTKKTSKKTSKKARARTTTRQTQKQVQNVRITLHNPSLAERGPKPTPFEKPYNTYAPAYVQGQLGAYPPRVREPLPVPGTMGPSIGTSLPLGTTVTPRPVDRRHMSLGQIASLSVGTQVDDSIPSLADRGLTLTSKTKDELYAHALQLGLDVQQRFAKEKLMAMIQSYYGN